MEVVQSQDSVAGADLDYINSVFAHNLAKLALARAVGQAAGSQRPDQIVTTEALERRGHCGSAAPATRASTAANADGSKGFGTRTTKPGG